MQQQKPLENREPITFIRTLFTKLTDSTHYPNQLEVMDWTSPFIVKDLRDSTLQESLS